MPKISTVQTWQSLFDLEKIWSNIETDNHGDTVIKLRAVLGQNVTSTISQDFQQLE